MLVEPLTLAQKVQLEIHGLSKWTWINGLGQRGCPTGLGQRPVQVQSVQSHHCGFVFRKSSLEESILFVILISKQIRLPEAHQRKIRLAEYQRRKMQTEQS